MKYRALLIALLTVPAFNSAEGASIPITYSLAGTGTVVDATSTTLTLEAQADATFLSGDANLDAAWNPADYSDHAILDLTNSLLNGTFTLVFADGDTLTGNVFEDQSAIDASQTGPFTQILTFTGGTGEFDGATGSLSGDGFLGTTDFTVSGNGAVNISTTPEPATIALIFTGSVAVIIGARRSRRVPSQTK
jgi:hypothetical protein